MKEESNFADQNSNEGESASEIAVSETMESENTEPFDWGAFTATIAIVLLIISGSLIFYAMNLRSTISRNMTVINEQESVIKEMKNSLQEKYEMLSVLENKRLTINQLSGLEVAPDARGKIIYGLNSDNMLIQLNGLPPNPENKIYQLWFFQNDNPVEIGSFSISNTENRFLLINKPPALEKEGVKFAVSLESDKNLSRPTGDFYLMSDSNPVQ